MDIWMNSIEELINIINSKKVSSSEIQQYFLKRINTLDEKLKAFIHHSEKIQSDSPQGVLIGIPYALKDNINALGSRTTAASKMLWNYQSPYDATVVKHLKRNGAILIGKTNMDEFSMGSTTENSAFFPTKNPWDLQRNPGGSSGGSAAAVATGMIPFALGSDTGGSIRLPASYCGIVGFKPTNGLVSRYGLIAFSSSMDQIGPITKNVRDAALILNIISGKCSHDTTKISKQKNYLQEIEERVDGLRIACLCETIENNCDNKILNRFKEAIAQFQWLGVKTDFVHLEQFHSAYPIYTIISSVEASSNLARYNGSLFGLSIRGKEKKDMIKKTRNAGFGSEVKRRVMLGTFNLTHQNDEDYYKRAVFLRFKLSEQLSQLLREYDAIITPVSGRTPGKLGESKTIQAQCQYDANTVLANLAGLPAISIPMGFVGTTPVGLQIMGKKFEDAQLLKIARAYEKTAGHYEDGCYPAPHLDGIYDV